MITIVDVGAIGGLNEKWGLVKHRAVLFEPNPEAKFTPHENWQVIRKALSDSAGKRKLYVARKATNSSFYKPNFELINQFPKASRFETVSEIELETSTLDAELEANRIQDIDIVKLDVQGHELPILKGGEEALKKAIAVEAEVAFRRMYENQPLFRDVDAFLRAKGFELAKFHSLTSWKNGKTEYLVWADAIYLKNDDGLSSEKRERLAEIKKVLLKKEKDKPLGFKLMAKKLLASLGVGHPSLGIKISQPAKAIMLLREKNQALRTFVETGTREGWMIEELRDKFDKLYSIELDGELQRKNAEKFQNDPKIKLVEGDSAVELGKIMNQLSEPALFWLDAHGEGAITADNSPIISELKAIFSHPVKTHVILIDDARHFDRAIIKMMKKMAREANYSFDIKDGIFRLHGR